MKIRAASAALSIGLDAIPRISQRTSPSPSALGPVIGVFPTSFESSIFNWSVQFFDAAKTLSALGFLLLHEFG